MNIKARKELMTVLDQISELAPYIRLGQLVGILVDQTDHPYTASPICDIEDAELLPAAREFLANIQALPPEYLKSQIESHLASELRTASA
jgi:hypothetical protein